MDNSNEQEDSQTENNISGIRKNIDSQSSVLQELFNQSNSLNQTQQNSLAFIFLHTLQDESFRGVWETNKKTMGKIDLEFQQQHYQPFKFKLIVTLTEGNYLDDEQTNIIYELKGQQIYYNQSANSISFEGINSNIVKGDIFNDEFHTDCETNLNIQLNNITNLSAPILEQIQIQIQGQSNKDCDLNIQYIASVKPITTQQQDIQAFNYSIFMTILAIVQMVSAFKILKQVMTEERLGGSYSLFTIILITSQDGYLSILHFFLSLNDDASFQYYIVPSFIYFIVFSVLEMRLIIFVWKERFLALQDGMALRRQLIKFYFKFYVTMIIMVIMFFNYVYHNWFLIALNLYLVPQIYHNAKRGQPIQFDKNYLFGLLSIRSIIPLYYRGCPNNFMELKTDYELCFILCVLIFAQILIIYYQAYLGPRFFIPLRFQSKKHNYFQECDLEKSEDCAVCILPLSQQPEVDLNPEEQKNMILKRIIEKERNGKTIMKTPCDHKFHVVCLAKWMSIRLSCPSCRSELPSLI